MIDHNQMIDEMVILHRSSLIHQEALIMTTCLSGAAKLARRQRGEKNVFRASAVENWSARGARWLFFLTFFSFSIQNLRLLSRVLAWWKI